MRHLALDKCIDMCKASETAASHATLACQIMSIENSMANNETIQRNKGMQILLIQSSDEEREMSGMVNGLQSVWKDEPFREQMFVDF